MRADQQEVTDSEASRVRVELDKRPISNMFDKAILQTLRDSMDGNNGPLRVLEKRAFEKSAQAGRASRTRSY